MLIKKPQHIDNHFSAFILSKTPRNIKSDNIKASNLYRTLLKTNNKVNSMIEMNKKFHKQLINCKYNKLKQLQRYSLPKKKVFSSQKSNQTLTPVKLKRQNYSKQKQKNLINKQTILLSPLLFTQKNFTLCGQKFIHERTVNNQNYLIEIAEDQITLSKQIQDSIILYDNLNPKIGFWTKKNKIVNLYPFNEKRLDKIFNQNNNPYILPLLGFINTKNQQGKFQKFVITDLYDKNTLKHLLNEFGLLDEITVKHYIRKLVLGVWHLHKNRSYHNRLTLDSLIYTQKGDILINMVMSSTKPLNQIQKYKNTYHFPPENLLGKNSTNSQKNDIWSIGCIVLQMLTSYDFRNNLYHPYNKIVERSTVQNNNNPIEIYKKSKLFMNSHSKSRLTERDWMKDSIKILQKVQKLIQNDKIKLTQSVIFIDLCESMYMRELSVDAKDFINKCLNLKAQKRPTIDQLMFHSFLKD